jgi:hypothetical protein
MKNRVGYKAFSGVIVVVFVVLVGALGYTYLVNNNSKLAKTDTNKTTTFVAPTITKTSDLDQATEVLDSTTFDEDLATLEEMENQL